MALMYHTIHDYLFLSADADMKKRNSHRNQECTIYLVIASTDIVLTPLSYREYCCCEMPNSLAIFVPENELAFRNLLISSPITLVKKFLGITLFKVKLPFYYIS